MNLPRCPNCTRTLLILLFSALTAPVLAGLMYHWTETGTPPLGTGGSIEFQDTVLVGADVTSIADIKSFSFNEPALSDWAVADLTAVDLFLNPAGWLEGFIDAERGTAPDLYQLFLRQAKKKAAKKKVGTGPPLEWVMFSEDGSAGADFETFGTWVETPEPGTLLLALGGIAGLGAIGRGLRRRRRRGQG